MVAYNDSNDFRGRLIIQGEIHRYRYIVHEVDFKRQSGQVYVLILLQTSMEPGFWMNLQAEYGLQIIKCNQVSKIELQIRVFQIATA
jgi:hypothetical protein